jgi:tRNA nucleotidyltransferase (CCA-adding enzyme)
MQTEERNATGFTPSWEHFPHGADIGVRGIGRSMEDAYEQVALALTAVVTPPDEVRQAESMELRCEAPDPELLLLDWLNALIFELSAHSRLFSAFKVRVRGDRLTARCTGEKLDPDRHEPSVEPKAATFTAMKVGRTGSGGFVAQCVVDV